MQRCEYQSLRNPFINAFTVYAMPTQFGKLLQVLTSITYLLTYLLNNSGYKRSWFYYLILNHFLQFLSDILFYFICLLLCFCHDCLSNFVHS